MTALLLALSLLCPGHAPPLASAIEDAAGHYQLDPVALVVLVAAESSCDPTAVNRRTHAIGLMQITLTGRANPEHLSEAQLMDPARNLDAGAKELARLLSICGVLSQALTLYHGGGKRGPDNRVRCQVDSHARKLLRRIRWIEQQYERERVS